MEKAIDYYLPLYGTPHVMLPGADIGGKKYRKVIGYQMGLICILNEAYGDRALPRWETTKGAKLVLRDISSMTVNEGMELASMITRCRDFSARRNKWNDLIIKWENPDYNPLDMDEPMMKEFNATGEKFFTADQVAWLLKKQFDLFELKESGIAIHGGVIKNGIDTGIPA